MKMIDSIDKLTWLYVNMVVRLHRVPVSIVLDQDPKFISCLWTSIRHALETKLNQSIAFHPQSNVQSERKIQ